MINISNPTASTSIKKTSLTSLQILALNSTPIELLPAPGAGMAYQIEDVYVRYNHVSAAYATNTTLIFRFGSNTTFASNSTILTSVANRTSYIVKAAAAGTTLEQIASNTNFLAIVGTGNPTGGDGTIDIYVFYKTFTF